MLTFIAVGCGVFGSVAAQSRPPSSENWQSATYHGGADYEFAETFVVDPSRNAYLLGRTFSGDMHPSVQPVSSSRGETASATFVMRLTPQGVPDYATRIGTGFAFLPLDLVVGMDGAAHALARYGDVTHVIKLGAVGGGSNMT